MIINNNISALNTLGHMRANDFATNKDMKILSSGKRINNAGDDASGLAVSEKMTAQVRGLKRATLNAQDDISFIQTTEGYVRSVLSVVHRLRELSVQSANGIYTSEDRTLIQEEVNSLVDHIDHVATNAHFNTLRLLTGQFESKAVANPNDVNVPTDAETNLSGDLVFHIGPNMDERMLVNVSKMDSSALGLKDANSEEGKISLMEQDSANQAIGNLDLAIAKITKELSSLGAYQNRLEFTVDSLMNTTENVQASESRIRDADMAAKSVDFFKNQVLLQSSATMMSQANMRPQLVLKLISG